MMPSRGRKFITEFLLPNLNKGVFGTRLMWLDIENKVFQIQWNHKSASDWTTNDAAVFAAWDRKKGHYNPDDKEYYPKSKQRFRAALYKFIQQNHITELLSEDKYTKIYCIGDGRNISGNYVTVKNEKENDSGENSQKVNQKWNSIWNANLLTESQENCLATNNFESPKESFKGKGCTDDADEFMQEVMYHEDIQSYDPSSDKNFSAQVTSNIPREREDMKSVHFTLFLWPDDNIKKVISFETDNYQDYLCTDPLRLEDSTDYEFQGTDEDLSKGLPLPCI